jgi:hypothetical protein
MAISGAESRYGIPFPLNTDTPDMEAYGRAIAEKIAAIELGQRDLLQAGVLIGTDWEMTANIVGGTGELGSVANTGGTAWLPDPVLAGSLMRSVAAPAKLSALKPPALPVSTKFMSVGVQLTPSKWGAAPTVSLVSGVEQASEALALTNPAAAVAGKVRIRDVVILNTAGVFSIAAQRDRRPWALGANTSRNQLSTEQAEGTHVLPSLTTRLETSGRAVRLEFGNYEIGSGAGTVTKIQLLADGVVQAEFGPPSLHIPNIMEVGLAAGSHLFTAQTVISGGTKTVNSASLRIFELPAFASNGTS